MLKMFKLRKLIKDLTPYTLIDKLKEILYRIVVEIEILKETGGSGGSTEHLEKEIEELKAKNTLQDNKLSDIDKVDTAQDKTLSLHSADISKLKEKDVSQDSEIKGVIDAVKETNSDLEAFKTAQKVIDATQDKKIEEIKTGNIEVDNDVLNKTPQGVLTVGDENPGEFNRGQTFVFKGEGQGMKFSNIIDQNFFKSKTIKGKEERSVALSYSGITVETYDPENESYQYTAKFPISYASFFNVKSVNGVSADESGNITLPSGGGSYNRIEGEGWHVGESESTKGIEAVSDKQIDLKAEKVVFNNSISLSVEENEHFGKLNKINLEGNGKGLLYGDFEKLSSFEGTNFIVVDGGISANTKSSLFQLSDEITSLQTGPSGFTVNKQKIQFGHDNNLIGISNEGIEFQILEGEGLSKITVKEIIDALTPEKHDIVFGENFYQNTSFGKESLIRKGNEVHYKVFAKKDTKLEVGDLVFTVPEELRPTDPEFIVGHGGEGSMVVWLKIDPITGGVYVQEFPNKEIIVTNSVILSGSYFINRL